MVHRLMQWVAIQQSLANSPELANPALFDDCILLQTQRASTASVIEEVTEPMYTDSSTETLLQEIHAAVRVGEGGHPFWELDWSRVFRKDVLFCCIFLGMAGILCSAGGIGGGGIYVTVLMVAGSLSPHDAVPLSKAVVFFGSMSSLVLNLRKSMSSESKQSLIDYNICRLVVPAALAGTLGGVYLNRHVGDVMLLSVLSCILIVMTIMTLQKTWSQRVEEDAKVAELGDITPAAAEDSSGVSERGEGPAAKDATLKQTPTSESVGLFATGAAEYGALPKSQKGEKFSVPKKATLGTYEALLSLCTLLTVVSCGVLRFHAGACQAALSSGSSLGVLHRTCHHPTMRLLGSYLQSWMASPPTGEEVLFDALAIPLGLCFAVNFYYGYVCVTRESWSLTEVVKYSVMASTTGCLAGLVGIGGGLIFSPFFLISGVDPAVAVATSSTCVIFTSSSTTLQYLLTDRIITSLTIVYGLVNLVASYVGTSLVHMLQDRLAARKSYITSIVAVGVLISTVLAAAKLWDLEHAVHPVQIH